MQSQRHEHHYLYVSNPSQSPHGVLASPPHLGRPSEVLASSPHTPLPVGAQDEVSSPPPRMRVDGGPVVQRLACQAVLAEGNSIDVGRGAKGVR